MPLQQAIWRFDKGVRKLPSSSLSKEIQLEELIEADPSVLSSAWLIIGRQVTSDVGPIDLLAVDANGTLIVIELKRDQTTRDVTAQALDYAAWVESRSGDEIASIYAKYCERYQPSEIRTTLDEAFKRRFGVDLPTEELNAFHQIVLVASELDARTERIVRYLASRGLDINVLFFQVFADDDRRFLSRVWMMDQVELLEQKASGRAKAVGDWNGEYYVSFGLWAGEHRTWEDAVRYGFISAGGGRWYSNTLRLLQPGARVWVNVPGTGYVGVGEVVGSVERASDFKVENDSGQLVSILDVSSSKAGLLPTANDPDLAEYFVPVQWVKTVPLNKAIKEVGFFGNQNSVCQPVTPKWAHTVERVGQILGL